MNMIRFLRYFSFLFIFLCLIFLSSGVKAQKKMDRLDRERVMSMLKNVKKKIQDEYFDPNFKGMDIEARFAAAEEKLKSAETLGQAFGIIAQAVIDLNDSHTRFSPPARNVIVDYGWRMSMFGDKCLVTLVNEKSDAAKKGLSIGDEIITMNGFPLSRSEMWKMIYYYQQLNPQTTVALSVRKPNGKTSDLTVTSKVTQQKTIVDLTRDIDFNDAIREGARLSGTNKHYFKKIGGITIWKMPSFVWDPREASRFTAEFAGQSALILDLRGNPGGYVVTLEKIAGYFFEEDKKIADLIGRKEMDPQIAKSQGKSAFKGRVVVLLDSSSGSAAEIFARLIQLERRGVVLGDVSAGAVMQSRGWGMDAGSGTVIAYGVSVTNADVIMSDGKSLEHVGVQPDEVIIPTGEDLAKRRDPVMARALELLGVQMTTEDAGKLFPAEKYIERTSNMAINLVF